MKRDEAGLIEAAKGGDQQAFAEIVRIYMKMIRSIARHYYMQGGDREDLIQEGRIGLWKAVRDFSTERGYFSSFAEICITRHIITAVKTASRQKHTPLRGYVSIDRLNVEGEDDPRSLLEQLTDIKSRSAEDIYVDFDQSDRVAKRLARTLSPFEASVLRLHFEGHTYEVIAKRTDKHTKAVDNGLQRVRTKYREALVREGAN